MTEDETRRRRDDDDDMYIPPLTKMKGFMYFVGVLGFILIVMLNDSTIEVDPIWDRGLLVILIVVVTTEVGARMVKGRSPKFIGNMYGDSIASNNPQMTIKSQGSWPELGLWCPGSVDGLGVKTYMTTNCYAIFPTALAVKRGVNLDCNAFLIKYTNHDTLPPHVRNAIKRLVKPPYRRDIPVIFGIYPDSTNELTTAQRDSLTNELEDSLGVPKAKGAKVLEIFERYAAIASPFRYDEKLTDTQTLPTQRIQELNEMNSKKDEQIAYWQDYSGTLEDKLSRQRGVQMPSLIDRVSKREEIQDQDG